MKLFVAFTFFISFCSNSFATLCVANTNSHGVPGLVMKWFEVQCSDGTQYTTQKRASLIFVVPVSPKKKNARDLNQLMTDLNYQEVAELSFVGETDPQTGRTKSYFAEDYDKGVLYFPCESTTKLFDDEAEGSSYCVLSKTAELSGGIDQTYEMASYLISCNDGTEEIKYGVTFEQIDEYMQRKNYRLEGALEGQLSLTIQHSAGCALSPNPLTAQYFYKR